MISGSSTGGCSRVHSIQNGTSANRRNQVPPGAEEEEEEEVCSLRYSSSVQMSERPLKRSDVNCSEQNGTLAPSVLTKCPLNGCAVLLTEDMVTCQQMIVSLTML